MDEQSGESPEEEEIGEGKPPFSKGRRKKLMTCKCLSGFLIPGRLGENS